MEEEERQREGGGVTYDEKVLPTLSEFGFGKSRAERIKLIANQKRDLKAAS